MEHNNHCYLPTYDACYVCGQEHPSGLRARFFVGEQDHVFVRFIPLATQTGYDNVVHGGVIAALMDELLGWVVVLKTERMCFTAEITLRYLKPITTEKAYVGDAGPCIDRKRYWESQGKLCDSDGTTYAKAHGKFFLLSREQTTVVVDGMTFRPDDLPVLSGVRSNGGART
ncbi:MAG: PaaI family thioesterase [Ignavibacteriae bacterium]|nr:PaaI family thioesterase [Ignavibacteriota bacterium]